MQNTRISALAMGQVIDSQLIIRIMWQDRLWIVLMTTLMLTLATIYLWLVPAKWSSQAIITLPDTSQVFDYSKSLHILYDSRRPDLPTITEIQNRFFDRFYDQLQSLAFKLKNRQMQETLSIIPLNSGSRLPLILSYQAETPQDAQRILTYYIKQANDIALNYLFTDLKSTIHSRLQELNETQVIRLAVAQQKKQRRLAVLQQALRVASKAGIDRVQVRQAETLSDDTLFVLGSEALTSMTNSAATYPLPLTTEWFETQQSILAIKKLAVQYAAKTPDVQISTFHYVTPATLPTRRDSSGVAVTLFISLLLGLISGSLLVLGRHALAEYRHSNKSVSLENKN